ncbi:phage tail terminator family protein [[Clostridium] polysaccharolyticum]|uniref:Uncharacterized protein n=1 Tax=[Clostridium] polysaccharolyticum TaxID=29364 RepID=A0A1H9YHX2_9FIRM|nr:hypothetical protein SAMN04487772_10230 [[Clostridium] polysaccharolyticum]
MINEIIQGIVNALDANFNKNSDVYDIYTEEIKQGLQEPCFFIQCINPSSNLFRDNRYKSTNQFCIQYFPADKLHKQRECNSVSEELNSILEYITVSGNLIRGSNTHSEFAGDVLSYFVDYNCFTVKQVQQSPSMGTLQANTSIVR